MKTYKLKLILSLWLFLGFTLALAQGQPMMNQSSIVGVWQTTVNLGQGVPPLTGIFTAKLDGSYREEYKALGKPAAFYEGRYTLTADGTFTQTALNKSPQICVSGRCMPNDTPPSITGKLIFQGPNSFVVTTIDPKTGKADSETWQRIPGAAIPGRVNNPNPQNPGGPLGPVNQSSWTGAYTDGQLKLVLQDAGGMVNGLIELGGNRYQLQAQGNANSLQGSFRTQQGQQFPLTVARANGGVSLTTGGKTYQLQLVPGNSGGGNPLGN